MIESSAFCTEPSRYFPAKIPSYAAAQARRLCEVEGEVVINERVEQRWFLRFNTGEESTKYLPRSGILKLRDIENIHRVLKGNQQESTRKLSEQLAASRDPILHQIKTLENLTDAVDLYLMNCNLNCFNVEWISVVRLSVIQ